MVALLARENPPAGVVADAFAASHDRWQRSLALEACAVQLDWACRRVSLNDAIPPTLRDILREATARAVREALTIPAQIAELGEAAREGGIRVLVLKGAARVLDGAIPGGRSMADIDVLAEPGDAAQLHTILQRRLGYHAFAAAPEHHLPTLTRPGALPVEVHVQLGPRRTALDARIWRDARCVRATHMLIPSPTATLLHALEHGALVHWAVRYRLRDLLDVAEAWMAGVDQHELADYLRGHAERAALMTMLGGARRFAPSIPIGRPSAWRTVRRVAWARHLCASHVHDRARATSLCIAAGVLAEASPRALLRPAQLALFGVKQARVAPMGMQEGQAGTA